MWAGTYHTHALGSHVIGEHLSTVSCGQRGIDERVSTSKEEDKSHASIGNADRRHIITGRALKSTRKSRDAGKKSRKDDAPNPKLGPPADVIVGG